MPKVLRLQMDGRRVTGVLFDQHGQRRLARAQRGEVILAAGAINSPALLELSGIGQPDRLAALGIAPVHALPGVGENLQDHLQLRTVFRIRGARTLNDRARTIWGKAGIALEYALRRTGPMAMAPSQLGIFARSSDAFDTPNIEYHVQPLSLGKFGDRWTIFSGLTVSVCNLRPESTGSVHITAPDPRTAPAIAPRYLTTEGDRQVAIDSLRHARRLMATARMAEFAPEEHKPGAHLQSDADLAQAAGEVGTTIFHPVGTTRMGSDPMAVVDAQLRVPRAVGPAHRRCRGDARDRVGQHPCTGHDDRGQGGGDDPGALRSAFRGTRASWPWGSAPSCHSPHGPGRSAAVSPAPFVIVQQRPVEEPAHVHALIHRRLGRAQVIAMNRMRA